MSVGTLGRLEWAAAGQRCAGERVSGDLALLMPIETGLLVAIFDGLGHGERAHEAAEVTRETLAAAPDEPMSRQFERVHAALRVTVGGALGLALFSADGSQVVFGGIGNTVARRLHPSSRTLSSSAGVLGQRYSRPGMYESSLAEGDVWILHTDGISRSFGAEELPQTSYQSARTLARTVVRRFSSFFDDATCVIVRVTP
ncbi:MAG: SpoIIE family protein phosphatase [Deltaproteobacteria bacterium]|nr:SpoIIE family protein phosphatase [Deltaproteobacteria bacterium]